MSFEELMASLARDTEVEREKILREGREQADKIIEQARAEAERIRQSPREEAARRIAEERARRLHAARLEGEAFVGRTRSEIFEAARKRVAALAEDFARGDGYAACLEFLAREALAGMEEGTVTVRPRDRKIAEKICASRGGRFSVVSREGMPPGVVCVSPDGLVEVDNTLPARLRSYFFLNEPEAASLVFGGRDDA